MSSYFYNNLPEFRRQKFKSVRSTSDNFLNILAIVEFANFNREYAIDCASDEFDVAIFTGEHNRVVVKKSDGYFSMTMPFQIIDRGEYISFNCNQIHEEVDGYFISIMRNIIRTFEEEYQSHEGVVLSLVENFNMGISEATMYFDAFSSLIAEDHGYFRFDDDPHRANGNVHPRYHFDIFCNDSSALKVGYDKFATLDCLYSLFDKSAEKQYLKL